jgi:hypothetical protein
MPKLTCILIHCTCLSPFFALKRFILLLGYRECFEELSRLQQEYVHRVEEKIISLEMVENGTKVRALREGGDLGPAVLPTTEELAAYIHEYGAYEAIEHVQQDALQRAEESVAIAQQTYSLVDATCRRLDGDLTELELLLQVRDFLCVCHGVCLCVFGSHFRLDLIHASGDSLTR